MHPSVFGVRVEDLGLAIFFSISGFMIVQSWDRTPVVAKYLWHRSLRLFPALWVNLLVVTLVLGPLLTTNVRTYVASIDTYAYLGSTAALMAMYELPGVFDTSVHDALRVSTVNGSLWSLGVEWCCYLGVVLLSRGAGRYRQGVFVCAFIAVASVSAFTALPKGGSDAAIVVCFFAAGCFFSAFKSSFTGRTGLTCAGGVVGGWALCWALLPEFAQLWAWLCVPPLAILVGRMRTPVLVHAARFGDLSYGVYLWSFVVQQIIIQLVGNDKIIFAITLTLILSLLLAWASWHWIEHPALQRKHHKPWTLRATGSPRTSHP